MGALLGGALVVGVVVLLLVAPWSSGTGPDAPPVVAGASTVAPPAEEPAGEPGEELDGQVDGPDLGTSEAVEDVAALPAVDLTAPARYDSGVVGSIDVEVVDGQAVGPGEVARRALLVRVTFDNASDQAVSLDGVVVDVYGSDGAPGSQLLSDTRVSEVGGDLAPGASATGTYVVAPAALEGDVTVVVSYHAGVPSIAFTGEP